MEPSNWQTRLSTIRERNEHAFNKSLFCDVEFSVVDLNGVKVTIPANKYILAVSSPVFEAMFYGKLAESKPTIDLPDCTKEGLQEMLRYVHSDEVYLDSSIVMEVLYLADKYMMPFLKEKCKKYIGPDDVLIVLPEVQKMGDEDFQKHLWGIFDNETHRAVSSEPFLNVSRELLCQILVRDSLNINELDLFRAVDRWVGERITEKGLDNNGKTKRSILGEEVIRLIRFPLMMQKDFAEVVLPSKILKKDEVIELVQTFSTLSSSAQMFISNRRHVGCLLIPSARFSTIIVDLDRIIIATTDFTSNKTIYLVGVRMFGREGGRYFVKLTIYRNYRKVSSSALFFVRSVTEEFDDCYYGFTIDLNEPIKLDPDVVYTLKARIGGPPSPYTYESAKDVVVNDITLTFKNSRFKNFAEGGQFPTLLLKHL